MKLSFLETLNFSRYAFIGVIATSINYLLFLFSLHFLRFSLYPSLLTGYIAGCLISFHFGRTWVFGVRNRFNIKQLIKFFIAYGFGTIVLKILSTKLDSLTYNSSIKWLISIIPIVILNYSSLRLWVFKKNK